MSGHVNLDAYFQTISFRNICIKWAETTVFGIMFHPWDYAITLIQLGYEPFLPEPFGPTYKSGIIENVDIQDYSLPSIFDYVKYIKSVDGFWGCYRGLLPSLCAQSTLFIVANSYNAWVVHSLNTVALQDRVDHRVREFISDLRNNNVEDDNHGVFNIVVDHNVWDEEDETIFFVSRSLVQFVAFYAGVVASHPFHVITVRCMGQFMGRETKYNSIFGSVLEIFRNEGISGFYKGLSARIVGYSTYFMISASITLIMKKVFNEDLKSRTYQRSWVEFLSDVAKHLIAPFYAHKYLVLSNDLIANDSGLVIGSSPKLNYAYYNMMPPGHISNWFRRYSGPFVISNGQFRPSHTFGPIHPEGLGLLQQSV